MAKKTDPKKELATTDPRANLPSFLAERDTEVQGMEELNRVVRPPYVKVVQSQSTELIQSGMQAGDVVLRPTDTPLPEQFHITPLYVFTEYCCVNPYKLKDKLPMIRERTLDHDSELADKARALETAPCPEDDKEELQYRSVLVYIVWIHELELMASVAFSGSEYKTGSNFGARIRMRNQSLFTGKYVCETKMNSNDQGNWFGFDIQNDGWIEEGQYDTFEKLHGELKANASSIQVTQDDHDTRDEVSEVDPNTEPAESEEF